MVQVPAAQIPGVYHRRIGDIVVTALSDGYLDGVVEVMQNIAPADATQMLTDQFRPGRRTSVNCYLVYSAGRLALVETGSGDYLLPTAGKLQQNLKAAGVNPADIDTVILTHMHPDHSAGLTNPKTGEKFFPNAELVVHQNEPRHWQDDGAMSRADARAKKMYFECTREQIAPVPQPDANIRWCCRGFSRHHVDAAAWSYTRSFRLHDRVRRPVVAYLGRHHPCP